MRLTTHLRMAVCAVAVTVAMAAMAAATSTGCFTDNGDGTILDCRRGLMWEKKSWDGSIHDFKATFTWGGECQVCNSCSCNPNSLCVCPDDTEISQPDAAAIAACTAGTGGSTQL
jgi:hypothetical protein